MLGLRRNSLIAKIEYGGLLNFLASTPPKFGILVARIRGLINGTLKRDFWRMDILNDITLVERIESGFKTVVHSDKNIKKLTPKIFHTIAREELESAWLAQKNVPECLVEYHNYGDAERYMHNGGRVVFLTSHYGSNILGIALLGKLGLKLLTMSSDFFMHNPMVPDTMKKFYTQKYAGLASYLNGGDVLPQEGNLVKFYRFLRGGGHVVILGDLPAMEDKNPLWIDYFGKKRGFSQGAVRMAESENAAIVSFVCKPTPRGYTLYFSDVFEKSHDTQWYVGAYTFLEKHIKQNPELYYGIDLIPLFPILSEPHEV